MRRRNGWEGSWGGATRGEGQRVRRRNGLEGSWGGATRGEGHRVRRGKGWEGQGVVKRHSAIVDLYKAGEKGEQVATMHCSKLF